MLKETHPGKCAFFGSIGNDEIGQTLTNELERSGIHSYFSIDAETPTGSCAVLVHKKERTLCANLAACVKYKTDHLASNLGALEKAHFLYTSAFFMLLTHQRQERFSPFPSTSLFSFLLSVCLRLTWNHRSAATEECAVVEYWALIIKVC